MAKMILTNGFYVAEKGSYHWITDEFGKFQDNANIAFWFADLPNLTNGTNMFSGCTNLRSFSGDLPNLEIGSGTYAGMFNDCKNLASFSGDLSKMTNGYMMFYDCKNLASFSGDLSALTNGQEMFVNCSKLSSFSSDLSSLTNGTNMFGSGTWDCTKLDLASVQNIANTINDLTAAGTTSEIHIGMASALQSDDETAPINVALAAIRAKGWTVNEIYRD